MKRYDEVMENMKELSEANVPNELATPVFLGQISQTLAMIYDLFTEMKAEDDDIRKEFKKDEVSDEGADNV